MSNTIYNEHGFENREEYLKNVAEDYGVDLLAVRILAVALGPDEDFDGLISALDDFGF